MVDASRLPVTEIAESVALEARCCPFLDFRIDVRGEDGFVKLSLTGGKGLKRSWRTSWESHWKRSDAVSPAEVRSSEVAAAPVA